MTMQRARGSGSKRQLPSGAWQLRWKDRRGAAQSVTLPKGTTEAEAEQELVNRLAARNRGASLAPSGLTFGDFATDWLRKRGSMAPSTKVGWTGHLRMYLVPALGPIPLRDLNEDDIQDALDDWAERGVSVDLRRRLVTRLRQLLKVAADRGQVTRNVALAVDLPRAPKRRVAYPSVHQVLAMVEASRGSHLEAAYLLAATTGIRQGELLALDWRDVHLTGPRPYVDITKQALQAGGQVVPYAKTPKSIRRVPLMPDVVPLLRSLSGPDHRPVVADPKDPSIRLSAHRLADHHEVLEKRAGVSHFVWHGFRHYVAWLLLKDGRYSLAQVSAWFGHANLNITVTTYGHLVPQDLDASAALSLGAMRDLAALA